MKAAYSRQHVLENVLSHHPTWVSIDVRPGYAEPWDALVQDLRAMASAREAEDEKACLGLVLLHLGQSDGVEAFLRGVSHEEAFIRFMSLDQVRYIAHDPARSVSAPLPADWAPGIAAALADSLWRYPVEDPHALENVMRYLVEVAPWTGPALLAGLRRHRDPNVAGPAIRYFEGVEDDEGNLEIIAGHLLEPGIRSARDLRQNVGPQAGRLSLTLSSFLRSRAQSSGSAGKRAAAAALAVRVLHQCLGADDARERLASLGSGWVGAEDLFDAAARGGPEGRQVLSAIAACPALEPMTRAGALLRLHDAGDGQVQALREAVVAALLQPDTSIDVLGGTLADLDRRGLVTFPELLRAAGMRSWAFAAAAALAARPREAAADAEIVATLRAALSAWAGRYEEHSVRAACELLLQLPRTPDDNLEVREALQRTIAALERDIPQATWLVDDVRDWLKAFA